ncbi:MAG TPA: hypothetical protein PLS30_05345 [Flavobacteriales bacterium]|nr:hypothetical protein [Flavobacteriales bacterium]
MARRAYRSHTDVLRSTQFHVEVKCCGTGHFFSDHKAELHRALIDWFRKELAEAKDRRTDHC